MSLGISCVGFSFLCGSDGWMERTLDGMHCVAFGNCVHYEDDDGGAIEKYALRFLLACLHKVRSVSEIAQFTYLIDRGNSTRLD